MSQPIIRVENLSKRYRIGVREKPSETLRGTVTSAIASPFHYLRQMRRPPTDDETLWALKNISFKVERGEVIGIIGRNGAGKSTLLKILSRITEPTEGRAIVHGRLGSLLEVGTGFHPELTGRENIYMSGTILGMKKREIDRKLDTIVAFADVEKFLDTPVKRYSSGMQVRLGFAVAAHLEPEVLIVDEVLAVGDLEFQKKCLGKMQDVGKGGRTVLFVSHNMSAITALCQRAIWLDGGIVLAEGAADALVAQYVKTGIDTLADKRWQPESAPATDAARLLAVRAVDVRGTTTDSFDIRKPIGIELEFEVLKPRVWFTPNIQIKNELEILLFNAAEEADPNWELTFDAPGIYRKTCWIPGNFMAEGIFTVNAALWGFTRPPSKPVRVYNAIRFHIYDNLEGDSVRGRQTLHWPGVVRPMLQWTSEQITADEYASPHAARAFVI
jgi:lipopolysaccharide transport system ATP-binding protein